MSVTTEGLPELRRDGPVVLLQAETDPGDRGEPREWVADGVTYLVVPSFDLWPPDPDATSPGERLAAAAQGLHDEARLLIEGVNELHRQRGRMSKVTIADMALLLGAVREAVR